MVSDSFQGGCACENAAGLRIGTDNVEFAALTAPRPMKMVGATGDWTARTMTNAFPTLQMLVYAQTGATDRLGADVFDFPHNYNQTSRNAVYAFLGKMAPRDRTTRASTQLKGRLIGSRKPGRTPRSTMTPRSSLPEPTPRPPSNSKPS